MKILITQSYWRILDPKEFKFHKPYPPLGTLFAATILKNDGHEIFFLDGMIGTSLNEFTDAIEAFKPDLVVIYDDEFNYLTKMCLSNMREATLDMIRFANDQHIPSVVYSSDAVDHAQTYLKAGCDAVIVGEGELTAQEIVKSFSAGCFDRDKLQIPGIHFLEGNEIHVTPKRPFIENLDFLPDPNFDLVDIATYRKIWLDHHGYFSLNISTTRGCPYHCNWCAKPIYGQIYHSLSPQKIAGQFKLLKEQYSVDHIWITDDIFGLKPGWLTEFSRACEKLNIRIPYKCLTRADLLLRGETITELKQSGCQTVWIGAESGSQKILDAMEKGTRVEQLYEATRRVKVAGMEIAYFIQLGYTGENWNDILMTRKLIRDNLPSELGISVSYPLPGTKFYESVKEELKQKANWTDSDDLDLMYEGLYSKRFYRVLHRFIHSEYRGHLYLTGKKRIYRAAYHFLRFWYFNFLIRWEIR